MVVIKAAMLGASWWVTEYCFDGDPDQPMLRNWVYGAQAVTGMFAAGWNSAQGCE